VQGKSVLEHNVRYLQRYGITDVVVNVHHFADQIIDAINAAKGWGSNIQISDERAEVLETGGGLLFAKPLLQDADLILTLNADILTDLNLSNLIQSHQQTKKRVSLAVTQRKSSRGFLVNDANCLCGWTNTHSGEQKISYAAPSYAFRAYSGIACYDPSIFSQIARSGKFSLTDLFLDLAVEQQVHTVDFTNTSHQWMDVGTPEKLAEAEQHWRSN
jgi:NDP-sugar pyrophosphorylase family protein